MTRVQRIIREAAVANVNQAEQYDVLGQIDNAIDGLIKAREGHLVVTTPFIPKNPGPLKSYAFIPDGIVVKAAPRDLTGTKWGKLTVIKCVGKAKNNSLIWECECECGAKVKKAACRITKGTTQSCGCFRGKGHFDRKKVRIWNTGLRFVRKHSNEIFSSKKAWRDAAILTFGDKCQNCGWDRAPCDAHHKITRKDGGKNTIDNAIVLCPNCHRFLHHHGTLDTRGKSNEAA